ncbi:hypothetical protein [Hyphomicrobium sp. LHD-15]|uniref:hypothetical protein n=1 Tax=Hyphomicrobium sp. LHD-15 TaxID=3072142 RepID=UPI0028107033|nr:hypothetical protein [Hyphomicrobium sp. LHD-15]MDQ8697169.1 hypothetical protein [Hyphomicrobium sp. LHD-15]
MQTSMRAASRLEGLAGYVRNGLLRLIFGKSWACARYQRRHAPLAGPRPGARLD